LQCYDIKIVMQVSPLSAVPRIATHAQTRATFAPVANAAPILLGRICDEYVCATIALLRGALESSACSRKWNKVHVVGNDNQDICIFRVRFLGREGAD
jgi:hypothetical protein